jgi:Zn-dependent protease with chaperone function
MVRQCYDFLIFEFLAGALVTAAFLVGIFGSGSATGSGALAATGFAAFLGAIAFTFTSLAVSAGAEAIAGSLAAGVVQWLPQLGQPLLGC